MKNLSLLIAIIFLATSCKKENEPLVIPEITITPLTRADSLAGSFTGTQYKTKEEITYYDCDLYFYTYEYDTLQQVTISVIKTDTNKLKFGITDESRYLEFILNDDLTVNRLLEPLSNYPSSFVKVSYNEPANDSLYIRLSRGGGEQCYFFISYILDLRLKRDI
jgi:hypothetical protein